MDTTWFAVDRDGRVAAFESGEAGAVPTDAYLGEDYPPLEELPVTGEAIRIAPAPAWKHEYVHRVRGGVPHAAVFHLCDEAALAAEVAAGAAVRVRSEGSAAFRLEAPEAALVDRLHASGACLGCSPAFDEDGDAIAATRGLYVYEHVAENWIAGPYRLVAKPARPATLEVLPEDVREKAVRFDGRFDETGLLHPMALGPCESWEPAWIDLDGVTVRPVPGHEDDYAEQVSELAEAEPGLVFDPPPAPQAPGEPPEPVTGTSRPWWKLW
jgi:hypothetical protein